MPERGLVGTNNLHSIANTTSRRNSSKSSLDGIGLCSIFLEPYGRNPRKSLMMVSFSLPCTCRRVVSVLLLNLLSCWRRTSNFPTI